MPKPRKTPEQKLADLERQLAQTKARIADEKSKVRNAVRKRDTRRKIIAGGLALKHMEFDPAFAETMRKLIREQVERPEDQQLFSEL